MRFALVPRQNEFYDLFAQAGANTLAAAQCVERRFGDPATVSQDELKELEHEGDRLTGELIGLLNTQYVTPIDREDIYALASGLDDIVDWIEEVADFFGLYRIEAPMEQALQQAKILNLSCQQVAQAIPRLRGFEDLHHFTVEINRYENEGDRVVREALASLFEAGIDPMLVIRWKDIFERLEDAIDATESVSNILEGITIKNT